MEPIILASASPRRQEILKMLGIPFVVNPADISENYPDDMDRDLVAEYLATEKVKAVIKTVPEGQSVPWILGADTVIVFDGKIYGKPSSREEARDFICRFQGKTHKVVTGIALYNGNTKSIVTRTCPNLVTFKSMNENEIDWYMGTGEWHDAAGAYKIQGMASCFISKIEGTESGVMGLPMYDVYDMLLAQNYSIID